MLVFFFIPFLSLSVAASQPSSTAAENFSGLWRGKGVLLNQNLPQPLPVDMALSVSITATQVEIFDCWKGENLQPKCYTNLLQLDESGQIYRSGQKIGDLYPDRIVMFWSNRQASEQMFLGWSREQGLKYQYIFSAFDGASQVRNSGTLQKVPKLSLLERDEKWICEARDKFDKRYSSSPRNNFTDAREEALENCESFSTAPRTCRIEDCHST